MYRNNCFLCSVYWKYSLRVKSPVRAFPFWNFCVHHLWTARDSRDRYPERVCVCGAYPSRTTSWAKYDLEQPVSGPQYPSLQRKCVDWYCWCDAAGSRRDFVAESAANVSGSVTGSPSAGAVREELDQRVLLQSGQDSVLNGLRGAPETSSIVRQKEEKKESCTKKSVKSVPVNVCVCVQ